MCDRLAIHRMIPENPSYLTGLVRSCLQQPHEVQVAIWRELRRNVLDGEVSVHGYELWLHDMAVATGTLTAQLPEEIVQDIKSGKLTPLLCEIPLLNSMS